MVDSGVDSSSKPRPSPCKKTMAGTCGNSRAVSELPEELNVSKPSASLVIRGQQDGGGGAVFPGGAHVLSRGFRRPRAPVRRR